jgi:hypothetical protein
MIHGVLGHDCDADAAADLLGGRLTPRGGRLVENYFIPVEEVESDALLDYMGYNKTVESAEERDGDMVWALRGHTSSDQPAIGLVSRLSTFLSRQKARVSVALRPELTSKRLSKAGSRSSGREVQLAELLAWCRTAGVLSISRMAWTDDFALPEPPSSTVAEVHPPHRTGLRSHEVLVVTSLLHRAAQDCDFLFSVYTTRCWYWESVELIRKLILTSILALISPGSAGQVIVGLLVAFCALIANIKRKPYAQDAYNFVNQVAQFNLFAFLFVALLLKVNLDGDGSRLFFTGIVGAMTVLPVLVPVLLQAYIRLGGFGGVDARELKDSAAGGTL